MAQLLWTDAAATAQYVTRGIAHFKQDRFAEALADYDIALSFTPDDPYARWNKAMALLSSGDYVRGFQEHDVAWRLFHWRGFGPIGNDIDRLVHLPLWRGEDDVRLLLYHELGFGDAIMAMRYLPELKRRTELVLVIDPCLTELARGFDIEVTDALPDSLEGFDCRLPLFGAMSALNQTTETIPAEPYIHREDGAGVPSRLPNCSQRDHAWGFAAAPTYSTRGKIGIAWSGRTQTAFALHRFLSLLDHDGCSLHALQPGAVTESFDNVESFPPWGNFSDVAERIGKMDHVVSVDTAAIHLAGAMGHPSAHLLLPRLMDWRWHHSAVWYPTVKTYRQDTAEDWNAPFARLNAALK
jgi:tetratricopeptide (TPR) repeat protein